MIFTSIDYVVLLAVVFVVYWLLPWKTPRNLLILTASYVFYGYVHLWFLWLITGSIAWNYASALGISTYPARRRLILACSVIGNLGLLGAFKYFNFFVDNLLIVLNTAGISAHPISLRVWLPVGISFFTFQAMSYTIDVYRGRLEARRNLLDVAVFVSFFPQLVAGPIERAPNLLVQVERVRRWNTAQFFSAWPLLIRGFLKKLVIADNVAVFADKVFLLDHPGLTLLIAGTVAFAVQILTDFSAYTDIARGSARLLGFELMENFEHPYLSVSPSDFWRRWHISFSTWIRDYLYIPLGGSHVATSFRYLAVLVVSMGLSGLWHGAAWNFVLWGVYHALLLYAYWSLGLAGRWQPRGILTTGVAWAVMSLFTLFGWFIFRMPSLHWAVDAVRHMPLGLSGDTAVASLSILGLVAMYSAPLWVLLVLDKWFPKARGWHAVFHGAALAIILVMLRDTQQDFIYFQF
jgi:D-alanyl-lipoteichoic acid acyltransferase DltB (MBOAT superfamily)